jgi:uncharacterized membrane protein YcjF (UPF0283 family)
MMLKVIEVVVLIGAGLCFVVWQFRDLCHAREVTRQKREAQQAQALRDASGTRNALDQRGADGG